ncbi:endonuclease domain-containing protein [Aminobacter sp. MET-1]|uniref:endonuclease domain-containing protein n=1 Tax=Aminobacter sp. MET-1 TaxID=2951085 RepID=UPI00226A3673|nr:endonuclease domain-containing protein [Aminobacter sp. MET-1]MCX8568537.1 endonuclease domain-containing protein [Aminobacter sp. MET-1]
MPHQSVPARRRAFARTLRREATEAEDRLWQELRGRRLDGIKFRRQVPVGRFVADFLCSDAMLIVEVDGSQHAGSMRDDKRTAELNRLGFRALRFWNNDALRDMRSVCATILAYVRDTGLQPWR